MHYCLLQNEGIEEINVEAFFASLTFLCVLTTAPVMAQEHQESVVLSVSPKARDAHFSGDKIALADFFLSRRHCRASGP
ncbi:hypothetical protein [Ochrobactrum teleogrylli]|uniref:Uncharacterized protein n=1 Tax=Ochrobactrum teleogrylli TaxID=2479765 RepID=A0ABD5K0B2_9HYPH